MVKLKLEPRIAVEVLESAELALQGISRIPEFLPRVTALTTWRHKTSVELVSIFGDGSEQWRTFAKIPFPEQPNANHVYATQAVDQCASSIHTAAAVLAGLKNIAGRQKPVQFVTAHDSKSSGSGASIMSDRFVAALLFSDITGYSKLTEPQFEIFAEKILPEIAKIFRGNAAQPIHLNTWGDAIFCAYKDPAVAAKIALQYRDYFANTDWTKRLMPKDFGVRISLHVGTLFERHDPLTNSSGLLGAQVNLAARIEPVTPPGEVWVTSELMHHVRRENDSTIAFDDMGVQDLAKKWGSEAIYRLRRASEAPPIRATPPITVPTLNEKARELGIVDLWLRDSSEASLRRETLIRSARREIAITAISGYRAIEQHATELRAAVVSGKRLFVALLDPESSSARNLSGPERRGVPTDINAVLEILIREKLCGDPNFEIRFFSRQPTFTGIMIDGDLAAGGAPMDPDGQIVVQPRTPHATYHSAVLFHFRKLQGESGPFDYFAADMRARWKRDAKQRASLISALKSRMSPNDGSH